MKEDQAEGWNVSEKQKPFSHSAQDRDFKLIMTATVLHTRKCCFGIGLSPNSLGK